MSNILTAWADGRSFFFDISEPLSHRRMLAPQMLPCILPTHRLFSTEQQRHLLGVESLMTLGYPDAIRPGLLNFYALSQPCQIVCLFHCSLLREPLQQIKISDVQLRKMAGKSISIPMCQAVLLCQMSFCDFSIVLGPQPAGAEISEEDAAQRLLEVCPHIYTNPEYLDKRLLNKDKPAIATVNMLSPDVLPPFKEPGVGDDLGSSVHGKLLHVLHQIFQRPDSVMQCEKLPRSRFWGVTEVTVGLARLSVEEETGDGRAGTKRKRNLPCNSSPTNRNKGKGCFKAKPSYSLRPMQHVIDEAKELAQIIQSATGVPGGVIAEVVLVRVTVGDPILPIKEPEDAKGMLLAILVVAEEPGSCCSLWLNNVKESDSLDRLPIGPFGYKVVAGASGTDTLLPEGDAQDGLCVHKMPGDRCGASLLRVDPVAVPTHPGTVHAFQFT